MAQPRGPRGMTRLLGGRAKNVPKLDMAPMIDCVFQLLIFFMVTTSFAPMAGIRVQLPPPGKPSAEKPKGLIIRIADPQGAREEGTMVLNDEIVSYNDLYSRFISVPEEVRSMLIIQSEREVLHEQIIRIIDMAKQAGIDKIGFAMVARE